MLSCVNDYNNLARNTATALHHAKYEYFHNTVSFCLSVCLSVYLYVNNAVMHPPEADWQHSCLNLISLMKLFSPECR